MASFKYLIFVALVALSVYSAVAEEAPKTEEQVGAEAARVKKHAYIAAPLAYSSPVYPYAYSAYPSAYPYSYSYPAAYPTAYASYPSYAYAQDDGKYWPGKYEAKAYYPAYKTAYPAVYHY